VLVDGRISELL